MDNERVRWDDLFADLEAQAVALSAAERGSEIDERTRAENARLTLIDRLRPSIGTRVAVRCRGGASVTGVLRQIGSEWLLIDEDAGREAVIALTAVTAVAGLGRLSAAPDSMGIVESRLGLRHVLRGVARDRAVLRLQLDDQHTVDGTVDRVGSDFVEIAAHPAGEPRRRGLVREVLVVPISAIAVVRRDS